MLDVVTCDGEVFPVKRKLLRPCISLTQAVRDTQQASVHLASVNTLVFDRHASPCCFHILPLTTRRWISIEASSQLAVIFPCFWSFLALLATTARVAA